MKHSVKTCLKRGDTFLSHFDCLIDRCVSRCSKQVIDVTNAPNSAANFKGCRPVNQIERWGNPKQTWGNPISGAGKSLLGLYRCFIALVIFKGRPRCTIQIPVEAVNF